MFDLQIQSLAELLGNHHQSDGIVGFCVQPLVFGRYGVFANAVLIEIHQDQATADAHCQRLRDHQAQN
jgi:hypothetical protein